MTVNLFCLLTEQLYLATLKLLWYVETVKLCYASRPVDVLDLPKDAHSGGRVIDLNGSWNAFWFLIMVFCLV